MAIRYIWTQGKRDARRYMTASPREAPHFNSCLTFPQRIADSALSHKFATKASDVQRPAHVDNYPRHGGLRTGPL